MFAVLSTTGSFDQPGSTSAEQTKPERAIQPKDPALKSVDKPPSIPLPSPLNDSAWLEFVENSIFMSATAELPLGVGLGAGLGAGLAMKRPRNNTNPLPFVSPEFTHLRSNSTTVTHRPSLEHVGLGTLPKVHQILSRRNPKTRQAQQQQQQQEHQKKKSRSQDQARLKKRASVELIAEQYSAMLDYKDRIEEGLLSEEDEDEAPPPVPQKDDVEMESDLLLLQPRKFSGARALSRSRSPASRVSPEVRTRRGVTIEPPPPQVIVDTADMSPQSDCTLISFEEDVIYFKPISFGPSPPASPGLEPERESEREPQRRKRSPVRREPTTPRSKKGTRQLDMGLDLLHGELSSSLARGGCPRHHSEDRLSDLQLTIMIDAYENLRERTWNMDLPDGDRENMGQMFESWVSTLHNIRGSLATRGGLI